jgi:UDP-galactopyranose mutase
MPEAREYQTIILGGGLAGLSAAHFLGADYLVLEQESSPGGLARSTCRDGFVFDNGGHALHSAGPDWYALLRGLNCRLHVQERKAFVDTPGGPIPFPFQYHLSRLPEPIYRECLEGLLAPPPGSAGREPGGETYRQWLLSAFGPGICRHFMFPYNEKIWKVDLDRLTVEFAPQRVPSLERRKLIEVNSRPQSAYSQTVAYPLAGGIQAIPDAFRAGLDSVRCDARVTAVNLSTRTVTVNGGQSYRYEHLISTIPLPRFLGLVEDLPGGLRDLIPDFDWLSMFVINLGLRREGLSERQRLYVSDPAVAFHKVVYNMNSAPGCVPAGHSSISVEITRPKDARLDPDRVQEEAIDRLVRLGLIRASDPIVFRQAIASEFGYVLYDARRTPIVERCRSYLEPRRVQLCGRFGAWAYLNMDAVVRDARRAAGRVKENAG